MFRYADDINVLVHKNIESFRRWIVEHQNLDWLQWSDK